MFGRLTLRQSDRGELAKGERYSTSLTFVPAGDGAYAPDVVRQAPPLGEHDSRLAGDIAVMLEGRLRQAQSSAQGAPAGGTATSLEDASYSRLADEQVTKLAAELLSDASARKSFLARTKPLTLGNLALFVDDPVLNAQIAGGPLLFLRFRAYNRGPTALHLKAPTVRVVRGKTAMVATPSTACTRTIEGKGFTSIDAGGQAAIRN